MKWTFNIKTILLNESCRENYLMMPNYQTKLLRLQITKTKSLINNTSYKGFNSTKFQSSICCIYVYSQYMYFRVKSQGKRLYCWTGQVMLTCFQANGSHCWWMVITQVRRWQAENYNEISIRWPPSPASPASSLSHYQQSNTQGDTSNWISFPSRFFSQVSLN